MSVRFFYIRYIDLDIFLWAHIQHQIDTRMTIGSLPKPRNINRRIQTVRQNDGRE